MGSLDDPVVTPRVGRVDPPHVIPEVRAPAICSTYERWSEEEDPLLPGNPTQVLEAAIFAASDSLATEMRLCCLYSSMVRHVADDLMAAFDACAASQAFVWFRGCLVCRRFDRLCLWCRG